MALCPTGIRGTAIHISCDEHAMRTWTGFNRYAAIRAGPIIHQRLLGRWVRAVVGQAVRAHNARPSIVTESEERSKAFYEAIGKEGLAQRTSPEWDRQIVARLMQMIPQEARVLDLGCGYGRLAIPLTRLGYRISGVDLSPTLIKAARVEAKSASLEINFKVGSMLQLPYPDRSFDVIICMWSAFHELLSVEEQRTAVTEMLRVLSPGGWALLEGMLYEPASQEEIASGDRLGPGNRISKNVLYGQANPHYQHDQASYEQLMSAVGVAHFRCYESEWAGRLRLFLRFEKAMATQ